ncbi:MAG TPA: CAP domain-containing protein [Polyangiales bacterium]|nr:CAP domain-containing protein [Polyangiales bacterium]
MQNLARWFTYASLFVLSLAACGGDDGQKPLATSEATAGTQACITLVGMGCGCPGGTYGVYSCDGKCLQCPVQGSAGMAATPTAPSGAAGGGQVGQAGRSGRGMMTTPPPPPVAGSVASPVSGPAGAPALSGVAGMPAAMAGRGPLPAAGSGGAATGAAGSSGATVTGDVPATPVCEAVSMWPAEWTAFEQEVLKLVNENRAKGWNCDTEGMKPPAGPLSMEPTLRCSARLHSKDMADRMFFAHDNPDGENPGARMTAAGYVGRTWGENIAKGQSTPAQVVAGWMDSDGHCSNIMNATFNLIGVGYFAGMSTNPRFNSELYWTQNFGATSTPRR